MAAARAITIASNSTCTLLRKKPFVGGTALSLNNLKFCRTRRSYTCRAIYNPQLVVKEEGQPETLDYRVFFVDQSGKKVPFLLGQFGFYILLLNGNWIMRFWLFKVYCCLYRCCGMMVVCGLYLINGNVKLKWVSQCLFVICVMEVLEVNRVLSGLVFVFYFMDQLLATC